MASTRRLGLSRTEYVRRRLTQDAAVHGSAVGVQDLRRFAETFADLADAEVMSQAWRSSGTAAGSLTGELLWLRVRCVVLFAVVAIQREPAS
jgi:hypothetical protein